MKKTFSFSLILIFSTLLSSCAANKLLSSWSDETPELYRLEKVLVVGVAQDETKRRIYEDTFAESLTAKGVQAIPSYTVSKQAIEPSKEALQEVIDKTTSGSVLITHLVGKNEEDYSHAPQGIHSASNHFSHGLYGYYPAIYRSVFTPGNYSGSTKVILETNLYDVQTEKLLWSAQSQSIDPVMTKKYYQKLIELFLGDLKKNKFL